LVLFSRIGPLSLDYKKGTMGDSAGPASPTKPAVLIIGGLGMSLGVFRACEEYAASSYLMRQSAAKLGEPEN
jgi:hypothetical protein